MIYWMLFRHRWKRLLRGGSDGPQRAKNIIIGLFGAYFACSLAVVGGAFPHLLEVAAPEVDPVPLVNSLLLSALFGLLILRFFVQRSTSTNLRPYLSLPFPRPQLVRFVQGASLATLLNLFALAFFLPLWYRLFWQGPYPVTGALAWGLGVGLLVLVTHYANNFLRLLLAHNTSRFIKLALGVTALLTVDSLLGTQAFSHLSTTFFEGLLAGQWVLLLLPATALAATWIGSCRQLRRSLHQDASDLSFNPLDPPASFAARRGSTRNLMLLELKLIARNRRPSTLVAISALMVTTYVPILLISRSAFPLIDAFASLFVSGILAASYGQLMFSWDSPHFEGLMTRFSSPRTLIRAKLLLLQSFCVGSFLITLPLFIWLAPQLLLLNTGFLLYNVGVTCTFMLFFALWNRKRLAPERTGFFNFEGFSAQHWLGSLPVFFPPLLLLYTIDDLYALLGISVIGVLCMALFPTWTLFYEKLLGRHKYRMLSGFRS